MPRRVVSFLLLALLLLPCATTFAQNSQLVSRDIVVYTRDIAEIQEVRTVELERGRNSVRLFGIAQDILEGSVSIEVSDAQVRTHSIGFTALDFDIDKYWQAQVGEMVKFKLDDGDKIEGLLRMYQDDDLYIQEDDDSEALTVIDKDRIEGNKLENFAPQLSTTPSLLWDYTAEKRDEVTVRLTYLTEGMYWTGEHKIVLEGNRAGMISTAVVVNETGLNLSYDTISFIGGHIHLAGDRRRVDRMNPAPGAMAGGTESRFGDVRRWQAEDGELLADHNTRIVLLSGHAAEVKRSYVYDATIFDDRVSAHVEFDAQAALPYGDVRVYEILEGTSLFIGEDRIDDTPPGSPVDLNVGQVFDITAERTRMHEGRGEGDNTTQTYSVKLGNSGDDDVTVRVLERVFGDWTIPSANVDNTPIDAIKVDARTAAFDVLVPAGQTVNLTYEIIYER
ncbi:hypothetical protein KQI52_06900 [bacterium]|nr:hypothetical protein [bacterium]